MMDPAKPCSCKSGQIFAHCCSPFLQSQTVPQTAEQLMRSRYSAYVLHEIDYLRQTLWPAYQANFDAIATAQWAHNNHWTGLKILACDKGGKEDRKGSVLFEASYLAAGILQTHRELSLFRKKSGRWYYVEALPEDGK